METVPFEKIERVVYRGVSPLFTTYYLYWAEIGEERIPLIAFNRVQESNAFFELLERQAELKMVQESGN